MSFEIIDHLIELGARVVGSDQEKKAGDYLYNKFSQILDKTKIQEFNFLGWYLKEKSKLKILKPVIQREIDFGVIVYSKPIREEIVGYLEFLGTPPVSSNNEKLGMPKFVVKNENNEEISYVYANVSVNCLKGVPMANPYHPIIYFNLPSIVIGKEDFIFLKKLIKGNKKIKISFNYKAQYDYNARTKNIISEVDSISKRSIVIAAHYDSVSNCPGAFDNASGVQCMFNLMQFFSKEKPKKKIVFIATAGEESGWLGSYYYLNKCIELDILKNIDCFICIDGIGENKNLDIKASPYKLAEDIKEQILNFDAGKLFKKENITPMLPTKCVDSWPFYKEGIPVIFLENSPFMNWHLPEDNTYSKRSLNYFTDFYIHYIDRLINHSIL